jgi:hypothetical protein
LTTEAEGSNHSTMKVYLRYDIVSYIYYCNKTQLMITLRRVPTTTSFPNPDRSLDGADAVNHGCRRLGLSLDGSEVVVFALAQNVDIVVVVLVLLLVLVLENDLLLGVVDRRLEYLVGPLVLPPPVVVLVAVLEVVVADVGVPIRDTYVDSLVLQDA